jgi:hypothetical protein
MPKNNYLYFTSTKGGQKKNDNKIHGLDKIFYYTKKKSVKRIDS